MKVTDPKEIAQLSCEELARKVQRKEVTLEVGTLVEVLGSGDEYWYGEMNGYSESGDPLVTYIEKDEDGVYQFQEETYEAPAESINAVFLVADKKARQDAWKKLGFVYRGRHEIVTLDDVNSEDSDEDWNPDLEKADEDDGDESEEDADEDEDGVEEAEDDDDEEVVDEDGEKEDEDEDDDEDEDETEECDDDDDKGCERAKKKAKTIAPAAPCGAANSEESVLR